MRKKALVVEDDVNIAELLKIYLQKDGFEVVNVYDGGRAVALAETFRPDIILLDIMLPVMDGWQVCREVRKNSQVPIIMLTAKGESMDKISGDLINFSLFLFEFLWPMIFVPLLYRMELFCKPHL